MGSASLSEVISACPAGFGTPARRGVFVDFYYPSGTLIRRPAKLGRILGGVYFLIFADLRHGVSPPGEVGTPARRGAKGAC